MRQVDRLTGLVTDRVGTAIDRVRTTLNDGEGIIDLVSDLAYPLPVEIFSTWLGMPEEAGPQFRVWTSWVARSRDPMSSAEHEELFASLDSMHDYLEEAVEERRQNPTDDLLSYLVHADDGAAPMTDDELMSQLITLYMAGHEPTAGLVANGVLALLRHPDQLARLSAEPGLVPGAVHELLRYDGPNQFIRRVTTEPLRLGGVEIAAGEVLYVGLASANRDPRRWGSRRRRDRGRPRRRARARAVRQRRPRLPRIAPGPTSGRAHADGIPGPARRSRTRGRPGVERPDVHSRSRLAPGSLLDTALNLANLVTRRPRFVMRPGGRRHMRASQSGRRTWDLRP